MIPGSQVAAAAAATSMTNSPPAAAAAAVPVPAPAPATATAVPAPAPVPAAVAAEETISIKDLLGTWEKRASTTDIPDIARLGDVFYKSLTLDYAPDSTSSHKKKVSLSSSSSPSPSSMTTTMTTRKIKVKKKKNKVDHDTDTKKSKSKDSKSTRQTIEDLAVFASPRVIKKKLEFPSKSDRQQREQQQQQQREQQQREREREQGSNNNNSSSSSPYQDMRKSLRKVINKPKDQPSTAYISPSPTPPLSPTPSPTSTSTSAPLVLVRVLAVESPQQLQEQENQEDQDQDQGQGQGQDDDNSEFNDIQNLVATPPPSKTKTKKQGSILDRAKAFEQPTTTDGTTIVRVNTIPSWMDYNPNPNNNSNSNSNNTVAAPRYGKRSSVLDRFTPKQPAKDSVNMMINKNTNKNMKDDQPSSSSSSSPPEQPKSQVPTINLLDDYDDDDDDDDDNDNDDDDDEMPEALVAMMKAAAKEEAEEEEAAATDHDDDKASDKKKKNKKVDRDKLVLQEINKMIQEAEDYEIEDEMNEEVVEVLRRAAINSPAYTKRWYDALSDTFLHCPSLAAIIMDFSLIELAEEYYGEELPMLYTVSLRAVAAEVATQEEQLPEYVYRLAS